MENWLDKNNDGKDWVKVDENVDDGGWGEIKAKNVEEHQTK